MHAAQRQAPIPLAQPQLRSPSDFSKQPRLALLAYLHFSSDTRRMPVAPSRFDEYAPGVRVAGFGDAALGPGFSTGGFAGHQAQEGHQMLRVSEALQITEPHRPM